MGNVAPITPGIVPEIDVEREMLSYVAEHIRLYREELGVMPDSIAIVLVGADNGDAVTRAHSWSPMDENKSRLNCCAVAAAVLWRRAVGLDE